MKYFLAPLAGFTDGAFRRLCHRHGADLVYTEMVSAAGLAHGSNPTEHMMETLPGEGPVAVQMFGARPDDLAYAAQFVEKLNARRKSEGRDPFVELNLNAGCPMQKVTREGAGSALIRNPALINECLKAMKRETSLPVTLKTRPGARPDRVNMLELLAAAQDAGVAGMILHARFTSQMHGGEVHLDLLSELVEAASVPITGNGSVVDLATARAMAKTGVDAIMIGRAALANPWIFEGLKCDDLKPVSWKEKLAAFEEHLSSALELREIIRAHHPSAHLPSADAWACLQLHTHLFRYFNGRPGSAELRRRLNTIRTYSELRAAVDSFNAE